MKKFSTLFTLLLLASSAFAQLVSGTFDDGNASPTLTLAANVLSATLSASTKDKDCAGANNMARKLSASNVQNNFTLTITPSAGFEMTITDVNVSLLLSGSSGTANGSSSFGVFPASDIGQNIASVFDYISRLIAFNGENTDPVDINALTLATDETSSPTPLP